MYTMAVALLCYNFLSDKITFQSGVLAFEPEFSLCCLGMLVAGVANMV